VTLPVFYKSFELFNRFDTLFARDGIVRAREDGGSGFDTSCEVLLSLIVEITVLQELLCGD
jgi:hypothetical protein